MESKDVLKGCELICIGESNPPTDLIACPLTKDEQDRCKERRQYQAGMKWLNTQLKMHSYIYVGLSEWQAKLKSKGIEE